MTTLFPVKEPAEAVTVTFDFSDETAAVSSPTINVTLLNAAVADASPNAMKSGTSSVSGATVLQRFGGGLAPNDYLLTCQATAANGDTLVRDAMLPVRNAPV